MSLFESVRAGVTARNAAQAYGIHVNRNGMACCPFHSDRHPSMKLDARYHCFGCQADGDAIDLTGRLFGLEPVDAAKKLAADFGIPYEEPKKKKRRKKAEKHKEETKENKVRRIEKRIHKWLDHAADVLIRYRKWLTFWEDFYKPEITDEDWHPLFCEALDRKDFIDYLLDILLCSDDAERLDFTGSIEGR